MVYRTFIWGNMTLEIPENLRKFCILTETQDCIDKFACPVEGCGYSTRLGAGAIRMHLLLKADPTCGNRYCRDHELYYESHGDELGLDDVRKLASFSKIDLGH
jgi:hypothetical protein